MGISGGFVAGVIAKSVVTILLWSVFSLYLASNLYWVYEMLRHGLWYSAPTRRWGPSDIQVRILTVNNESIVRETVRRLPESFDDVRVVAEEPMSVPGAQVCVVPDAFECAATNKGRALEWARQTLDCDREYVLYLDEDSHMLEFGGLPDDDIVQFNEHPRKTTSWLTYFCEINRVGFQVEQRAFPAADVPTYVWGGGLAVRKSVEDTVTWDYPTVIEDTLFAWRAASEPELDPSFSFIPDRISNQAPPSLSSMFHQRRRWIAGSREENSILSLDRVLMYGIRDLSWSVTAIIPLFILLSMVPNVSIYFVDTYRMLSVPLIAFLYVWIAIGLRIYRPSPVTTLAVILLAPITTVLHSVGALWGLASHPETFDVTEKVTEPLPIGSETDGTEATTQRGVNQD